MNLSITRLNRFFILKSIALILFIIGGDASQLESLAQALEHPIIWTEMSERNRVLNLIDDVPWARNLQTQLINNVESRLSTHKTDPEAILEEIPDFAMDDDLTESQAGQANRDHCRIMRVASHAGFLYYLTQNEEYAQLSADILAHYVDELAPRSPQNTSICGNYFYDPRTSFVQFAIAYDFIYPFLRQSGTRVYRLSANGRVSYDHGKFQETIKNMAGNALAEYKGVDNRYGREVTNHPILTAPGALFLILCVDDKLERDRLFEVFWETGTLRQNSFTRTILPMFGEQGIWPESLSYSFMSNVTMILNIVDRIYPERNIMNQPSNRKILEGNFLFDNLRAPNRKFVKYGDSERKWDGTEKLYLYTLNLAQRRNLVDYIKKAETALKQKYDVEGGRNPRISDKTFESYDTFFQLLWTSELPDDIEGSINFQKPTVIIEHAGIALQRNHVENDNVTNGLCGIIGGAHYVHSHATGISMELYGVDYFMAPHAGLPRTLAERQLPVHTNYFRIYAGNNTVIMNGESRGRQRWAWKQESYLWQNTTKNVAAEPKHLEDPVNENFSFAMQRLDDEVNNGVQHRTLGIVRTSPTSAYYFDLFRSRSNGTNDFHDYVYHNLGDRTSMTKEDGSSIAVSTTNRYQNDVGDPVKSPGWRFFENTQVSSRTVDGIKYRFDMEETGKYMHMIIPSGVERDYMLGLAPPSREAEDSYINKPTQLMGMRTRGSAWSNAFIALFEASESTNSVIKETETLYAGSKALGARVVSEIDGKVITDYVIAHDQLEGVTVIPEFNLRFNGRYGVARKIEENGNTSYLLYIGQGTQMELDGNVFIADTSNKGYKEFSTINNSPSGGFTSPNGDLFEEGYNSLHVIVDATDPDGDEDIAHVTLFINNNEVRREVRAPYEWGHIINDDDFTAETIGLAVGEHILSAIIEDSEGKKTTVTKIIRVVRQEPYSGSPIALPGILQMENYDKGGQGISYNDTEEENRRGNYRPNEGVDLDQTLDNGYATSFNYIGEWQEYTVDVVESDTYSFTFYASSPLGGGAISVYSDEERIGGAIDIPSTSSWDDYQPFKVTVPLQKGVQVLKFEVTQVGFNLDRIVVEPSVVTHLSSAQNDEILDIFPNPSAEGVFHLSQKVSYLLYSLTGEQLDVGNSNEVDLSSFKKGVYILKTKRGVYRLTK